MSSHHVQVIPEIINGVLPTVAMVSRLSPDDKHLYYAYGFCSLGYSTSLSTAPVIQWCWASVLLLHVIWVHSCAALCRMMLAGLTPCYRPEQQTMS